MKYEVLWSTYSWVLFGEDAADIIRSKQSIQWTSEQFNKIKNIKSIMNKYKESLDVENNKELLEAAIIL